MTIEEITKLAEAGYITDSTLFRAAEEDVTVLEKLDLKDFITQVAVASNDALIEEIIGGEISEIVEPENEPSDLPTVDPEDEPVASGEDMTEE